MINRSETWPERQIREAEADPKVQSIRKMLASIEKITEPDSISDDSSVPEFAIDYFGLASKISQGTFSHTEKLPQRSDGVQKCQIAIIRTPIEDRNKHTLVHILSGVFDLNHPGYGLDDLARFTTDQSTAVFISGSNNPHIIASARQMGQRGITTVKHIQVNTGKRNLNVVYRPAENNVFVKIGNPDETRRVLSYKVF